MPLNIAKKVEDFLHERGAKKNDKLLIAVSGGEDSMCLLNVLYNLQKKIAVIHVNHQLRPEADADEDFVKKFCQKKEIEFWNCKISLKNRKNFENEARKKRYQAFAEYKLKSKARFVLTAHHLQDSLETTLINLIRGTGLSGLTGIPPKRDFYLRPFSMIDKIAIKEYVRIHKIRHISDTSNENIAIPRNLIRKKMVPLFEKLNPNFWQSYKQTLKNLRESKKIIATQVNSWLKKNLKEISRGFRLKKSSFLGVSKAFGAEILRKIFHGYEGKTLSPRHLSEILNLILNSKNSTRKEFGQKFTIFISAKNLDFIEEKPAKKIEIKLEILKKPPKNFNRTSLFVDGEKFKNPPTIGTTSPGDKFKPFGHSHKQKISKIFNSRGIPISERKNFPLLLDGQEIVAVGNLEISEDYKLSKNSKKIIKISLL